MALSPCQRHRRRIEAEQRLINRQALSASPTSLHLQLRELDRDLQRLADLPLIADKVDMKRDELLPKWLPTAEHYLSSELVHANPVFVWCTVWLFDVGNFDQALDWADIAIAQGQETPEKIKSAFPAFVADTVLAWAKAQLEQRYSVEPYFSRTFTNIRENWRVHEEISAKWYKFAGLMLINDELGKPVPTAIDDVEVLKQADELLATAATIYADIGVGTMRTKIAARIRSLQKT